jgi:cell division GTPase FtsZ
MKDLNSMIATEVLKPVFALVDEKVTLQEEREKVIRGIMDVLNAAKGIVSIDVNDVRDLFQGGGIIHTFDVFVDALKANRMNLAVDNIIRNAAHFEPYNHALVFFFFPEKLPLRMEELKPFSDWIESIPGEFMVKWGMATQSTQDIRAIVLLQ